jgi:ABC-type multidrug transport system ATPase subunit
MIRAEGLVKRYGAITAVDHLDFEVNEGETFALIGPNGAGKTTTLKILLGLARPDSGTVRIGPDALHPHDARARQSLGYVPQRVEFPPARTVAQVLSFFADLRGLKAASVDRALERVGLIGHRDRLASDLSGGYTQRLSLAQALLSDPALLVLDEPTASLDPEATWEFRTLIEQLRRERKTVVLSSHLLTEVERVADRVLILNEGRRAALESLTELRERQLQASRLRVELAGPAVDAEPILARHGVAFERIGERELVVHAANGRSLEVLESLRGEGIQLRSFQLQGPTLEEMFLAAVRGGRERGGRDAS